MALPTDVTQLVFENLSMDSILTCSRVSRGWRAVIFSNPLLAARIDVDKAIQIFNTNAQLGIDFITRGIGMINDTDHDIARWLECPRLNSQQVCKVVKIAPVMRCLRRSCPFHGRFRAGRTPVWSVEGTRGRVSGMLMRQRPHVMPRTPQPSHTTHNPADPSISLDNPQQPSTTLNNPKQPSTTLYNPPQPWDGALPLAQGAPLWSH